MLALHTNSPSGGQHRQPYVFPPTDFLKEKGTPDFLYLLAKCGRKVSLPFYLNSSEDCI